MTAAIQLFNRYSQPELLALARSIEADPANQAPPGGLFRLIAKARNKLADIDQAIAWHMEETRKAQGNPVPTCGYSGRKSNR